MTREVFLVEKPGLHTTIQDSGRFGFQQFGIVTSGVMDEYSYALSNLLVGNERTAAVLEIHLFGPTLYVLDDVEIAICGANVSPMVDGAPIPLWAVLKVKKNQRLSFGKPEEGKIAYVAILGGFQAPTVLGSKSTYTKGRFGGIEGRTLQKGDRLFSEKREGVIRRVRLSTALIPKFKEKKRIRVIVGPDEHLFSSQGFATFFQSEYTISGQSDRMGYRLNGPSVEHKSSSNIVSDAVTFGTIQIPDNGKPMIMLADHQTTGGYSRIGTVISVDLPYVVQKRDGDVISFSPIDIQTAQRERVQLETLLKMVSTFLRH
ncbi:biotin-dependent carboxyltransferase family protein [Alkalihalobacillus sp. LMS39]|uniref:5-oxoprolinase subunit C family protein n=1 Tax=Alkalihalobacillus sp. LMS39 TaxID=2924032 RepID=UPI001FB3B8A8|nr:biotin-dependent carboxyltransferase family protein [Alkalihalobacillus sp. LMS39]UOE92376.1 biotin-dependent carboxyltransferase family protein [Alkalihalobacillus sp. LMS39]